MGDGLTGSFKISSDVDASMHAYVRAVSLTALRRVGARLKSTDALVAVQWRDEKLKGRVGRRESG